MNKIIILPLNLKLGYHEKLDIKIHYLYQPYCALPYYKKLRLYFFQY